MPEEEIEEKNDPLDSPVQNHVASGGNIVQAGQVNGSIHFHGAEAAGHRLPPVVTASVESACSLILDTEPPDVMHSSGYRISLLVEGRSSQATILRSLTPVVRAVRSPRPAYVGAITAAALPARKFSLQFDGDTWGLWSADAAEFSYYVVSSAPEYFVVSVESTRDEVDFHLELEWACQGETGVTEIDHDGKPFRVHPGGDSLRDGAVPQHLRTDFEAGR